MIELRVDLSNSASVTHALQVLTLFARGQVPVLESSAATPAKVVKQKAEPKEEVAPKPDPEPAEDDLLGAEPEPEVPTVPAATRDDAAKVIIELSKKKGRAVAVALLEKFRPDGMPKTVKNDSNQDVPNEVKLPAIPVKEYGKLVAEGKKLLAA